MELRHSVHWTDGDGAFQKQWMVCIGGNDFDLDSGIQAEALQSDRYDDCRIADYMVYEESGIGLFGR